MDCSCGGNMKNRDLITAVARRDLNTIQALIESGA